MSSLTETFKGTTMGMLKTYIQQYIDHTAIISGRNPKYLAKLM